MWCVRAACHHAEAVRDEEEVGDRYGVTIGLEHTLLLGACVYDNRGVCVCMIYMGTAMRYAYGMQMRCRWNAYCTYGYLLYSTLVYMLYFEEIRPAANTRAAPRPRHRMPPATLAALRRHRQRRGVANGCASPTAV